MTPTSKGPLLDTEEERESSLKIEKRGRRFRIQKKRESQVGKQKKEEEGLEYRRRGRVKLENRKKRKKAQNTEEESQVGKQKKEEEGLEYRR